MPDGSRINPASIVQFTVEYPYRKSRVGELWGQIKYTRNVFHEKVRDVQSPKIYRSDGMGLSTTAQSGASR